VTPEQREELGALQRRPNVAAGLAKRIVPLPSTMTMPSGKRSMIARRLDAAVARGRSVSVIILRQVPRLIGQLVIVQLGQSALFAGYFLLY
jgi:hypothetical protein